MVRLAIERAEANIPSLHLDESEEARILAALDPRYCGSASPRQPPTEAIDLYREIGMPKHLEMAEELLAGA